MIARLLDRLTALLLRRPRRVLAVSGAIVVLFALAATRLRLDPDVLNLIPRSNREVNEFRDLLRETGTLDFHVIVVEFPKGSDPAGKGVARPARVALGEPSAGGAGGSGFVCSLSLRCSLSLVLGTVNAVW